MFDLGWQALHAQFVLFNDHEAHIHACCFQLVSLSCSPLRFIALFQTIPNVTHFYRVHVHSSWGYLLQGSSSQFRHFSDSKTFDIKDDCDINHARHTFGSGFINNSRLGWVSPNSTFFTGSMKFTIAEIQIFHIIDYTAPLISVDCKSDCPVLHCVSRL
jgi:hypothetical protein